MKKLVFSTKSLGAACAIGAAMLFSSASHAQENAKCPLMIEEDIDDQEFVEFKGHKILMCCNKCVKAWEGSETAQLYYAKAATELGLLPQLKGKEKELGFEDVELMEQRFSVVSHTYIVTPESPTVEYKGKTYYVFNDREVSRWNRDPDAAYAKAVAAGVIK